MNRKFARGLNLNNHQTRIVHTCVKLIYAFLNLLLMFMNGIEGVNPLSQSLPSLRSRVVSPAQAQAVLRLFQALPYLPGG